MTHEVRIDTGAIDALLEPYDRGDAPGMALGIAIGGRPAYRRGVGLASVELPVTLSPTIRMRIGSTTKHFCCLAVMLLAEENRLSIDDSPRRVLPELPDWAEPITIRQLMTHTSGMRDSLDIVLHASGPGRAADPDMQFRLMCGLRSVDAPPGARWSYNNGGYILLTKIVERVSGQALGTFMRERIFEPVGMNDTVLRLLDTELLPNSATLHVPTPGGGWTRGVFGTPVAGEGGIASTVDDMLRWLRHMDDPVVGTADTWALMRTPAAAHGYGLGLHMDEFRGVRRVHHGGSVVGGASQMLKLPDLGLDVALMSNGHPPMAVMALADAVVAACVPALRAAESEDVEGPVVEGTFHSSRTGRVVTLAEHEGRQALALAELRIPLRRDASGTLSTELLGDLRITPGADGGRLDVLEDGEADELKRVEPPAPPASGTDGEYRCGEAGLRASIGSGEDGRGRMRLRGELGDMDYALEPIGPDLWRGRGASTLPIVVALEFDADGFRLTTGRTNRLRFSRA